MKIRIKALLSCLIAASVAVGAVSLPAPADAAYQVTVDASVQSDTLLDTFNTLNSWFYKSDWTSAASGQPNGYFADNYPFVQYVRLFAATGGCYAGYANCNDRDLFVDPANASTMTDYKFDDLKAAIQNVLNKGLKPYIVTGNVPLKYSTAPNIGGFNVNTRPPADYTVYYNYIKALANSLVSQFGVQEMKSWRWGVLSEYENSDWFWDGTGSPNAAASRTAYFKLYDYTVAALQDAVGAGNLVVGAHAMAVTPGLWDPRDLIDHCASGTNYKTGGTGTQINFITASYYDQSPGNYTANSLPAVIASLRDRAITQGLTNLQVGVDEGWFLTDSGGKDLYSRSTGTGYQGAYLAKKIKETVDNGIDWFSVWALNANGVWGGASVPTISTNVISLAHKLAGDRRAGLSIGGSATNAGNYIDGYAGYNDATKTLRIFLHNYNPNPAATSGETFTLGINQIAPVAGSTVNVRSWTVDDTHANYWPQWWSDKGSTLSSADYGGWSPQTVEASATLTNAAARTYWNSRLGAYQTLAALTASSTSAVTVSGNAISLSPALNRHGVVLYEITNVTSLSNTVTATDEVNDYTKMDSHSAGLFFDSLNVSALGDTRRLARTGTGTTPEYVVYRYDNAKGMALTGLFDTSAEPISNFKVYSSPSGAAGTWTLQSGYTTADTPINGNLWTKRDYNWASLPAGTNYIKIEFPTGGTLNWNPQLSRVSVRYTPTADTDHLNDWSKAATHSAGLAFDTSNASALGDASRAMRTGTSGSPAEYITYHRSHVNELQAVGLFATDQEAIRDFSFYASRDGQVWLPVRADYADAPINGGLWTERTYRLPPERIPSGTNYVKVEYPVGGSLSWNPQLSQVTITQ
ncbi:GH39 family glycosyl hydrolase [Cohnella hashimotonis]|uniref:Glycosyl hydrolases family 39 N-terminal catalytic domain-containing protein n=1 Tax=Cohnella hashimotonis TaxID=2826895 RepID=A0ABT6TM56_9BACL|nr:hypothetical protein [Cohnella hashimotonis]MDI4647840.1 hypothetical protein [Cohnella hashimotonis]